MSGDERNDVVPKLPAIDWGNVIHRDPPTENSIGLVRVSGLRAHLLGASRGSAQFALRSYASAVPFERIQSALSAGSAVEYMLKCVIAAADPTLLAQRSSLDSVIALSRAVQPIPIDPRSLRTIDASEALKIVGKLHPTMKTQVDAAAVLDLRNSAAHMAMEAGPEIEKAVVGVVRVLSELLDFLKEGEDRFWGTNLSPLVREMKKKASDALAHRVGSKVAAAEMRFKALTRSLSGSGMEAILTLLERRDVPFALDESGGDVGRMCPACGRRGLLSFIKERDPSSFEILSDPDDPSNQVVYVSVAGTPEMFQCPVCDLKLDGDELTQFAGLHESIDLPDEEAGYPDEIEGGDWDY